MPGARPSACRVGKLMPRRTAFTIRQGRLSLLRVVSSLEPPGGSIAMLVPGSLDEVSRRRFLQTAGGLAASAVGVSLLTACAPTLPAAPTPAAVATSGSAANAVFPTFTPLSGGPTPTYAAAGPQYSDGFDTYPIAPARSVPEVPGSGGTVNIMSIQLIPPPTPLDQNPAWQAVNKALNADVRFNIVTSADYPVKLGTVMAGNDL